MTGVPIGAEGLFQEGHADSFGAADLLKCPGVQGLPLTISANSASRTEMTLPSWDEARIADQEFLLFFRNVVEVVRQHPERLTERVNTFPACRRSKRSTAAKFDPR